MIRVAAVGDLHVDETSAPVWHAALRSVSREADVLVLAGDLTQTGTPSEGRHLVDVLRPVEIPIVAVLGNHDFESGEQEEIASALEQGGVFVLEGSNVRLQVGGETLGVAGTMGFGGGFAGASGSDFGEPEMKAFMGRTKRMAESLHKALASLDTDLRLALLHYAPVPETLMGERLEIYPFLGSQLLAQAVDAAGADLVVHGHAHAGREYGRTANGVPVRNVAYPVIRSAYRVLSFEGRPPLRAV